MNKPLADVYQFYFNFFFFFDKFSSFFCIFLGDLFCVFHISWKIDNKNFRFEKNQNEFLSKRKWFQNLRRKFKILICIIHSLYIITFFSVNDKYEYIHRHQCDSTEIILKVVVNVPTLCSYVWRWHNGTKMSINYTPSSYPMQWKERKLFLAALYI